MLEIETSPRIAENRNINLHVPGLLNEPPEPSRSRRLALRRPGSPADASSATTVGREAWRGSPAQGGGEGSGPLCYWVLKTARWVWLTGWFHHKCASSSSIRYRACESLSRGALYLYDRQGTFSVTGYSCTRALRNSSIKKL